MPSLADHPDRAAAQSEVHARPIMPIAGPARIRRVAFLHGQDQSLARETRARVERFCADRSVALPASGARRLDFETSDDGEHRQVTWEFHTEFTTVTWQSRYNDPFSWPPGIGLEAVDGEQVALAVRIDLMATPEISQAALAGFDERSLCYSAVEDGRAQVATDFMTDAAGFTRYEVAAGVLGPHRVGALVRRLLEIETYRVLALYGIGIARSEAARLGELETRLAQTMDRIGTAPNPGDSAALLEAMYRLQLDASHSVERTRYRFAASHAYGDILMQRLRDLAEQAHGDHWTLQTYLRHRVEPALATYKAVERRQTAVLEQAARSTALLGTRISLDIDTQNRSILGTISDTSRSQFKLQRTVEGLSTIAITYYLLGILGYALHGLPPEHEHVKGLVTAIFAPIALVTVWLYLRRKQRH